VREDRDTGHGINTASHRSNYKVVKHLDVTTASISIDDNASSTALYKESKVI
jgi:hypothetical protein